MTGPALTPPPTSPFKFLDAYGAQDSAVFFGRDEEIAQLYRLLGESRLVLVYGQSGTGKTSLVQAGLTKKFSPTNWLPITVRRGDNLVASLDQALAAAAITPIAPGASTVEAIRSVFLDHLRPVFLIFDQFEELYVLGSKAEQEAFYTTIKLVLNADVSCRVIVLLREEYLAALDPFERAVPALFDKRLRIEVMTNSNVEKVILGTAQAHSIRLEHGADTARLIIDQLDDNRVGVQLAYLQVYLDHLYRVAARAGGTVTFTDTEIADAGKLGDIMAGFLDEQEQAITAALAAQGATVPPGAVARLLEEFVSAEGTKQPSTYEQVLARIPSAEPWLQAALTLLQSSRLLRQVDGHYELAHDALAGRIAERRSGERKQLLMVEKLVQDRMGDFAQSKTLLNAGELARVSQASKQVDPLDGSKLLRLDVAARQFVSKSRTVMWRGRIGWGAVLLAAILLPAYLFMSNLAQSQTAEDSNANASNVADVIGFGSYYNMRGVTDPQVRQIIDWSHGVVRNSNIDRDLGDRARRPEFKQSEGDDSFWGRLYDADKLFDGTNDPQGLLAYRNLEADTRVDNAGDEDDVAVTGKLKAVLWHEYFSVDPRDAVIGNKLFDLMVREMVETKSDPLGFIDDLKDLCNQTEAPAVFGKKCDAYPGKKPPPAPASTLGSPLSASALPANNAPARKAPPAPRIEYDSARAPGK